MGEQIKTNYNYKLQGHISTHCTALKPSINSRFIFRCSWQNFTPCAKALFNSYKTKVILINDLKNCQQTQTLHNRKLKQRRRRQQRERPKKKSNRFRLAKQQLCTFFLPSLHDSNVKVPKFRFCRRREILLFWTLIESFSIQLQKHLPKFDEVNEMEQAR